MLARRNGKVCRVACADKPGERTGYFAKPQPRRRSGGHPHAERRARTGRSARSTSTGTRRGRPRSSPARRCSPTATNGHRRDTSDSGLPALGDRGAGRFHRQADDRAARRAGGQRRRADACAPQSLLREVGLVRTLRRRGGRRAPGVVLRAGMVVASPGSARCTRAATWCWSVRHTITADSHKMKFVLVRNAVGRPGRGAGGLAGRRA